MHQMMTEAIRASLNAGKAILAVYESGFDVQIKEDNSPLTQADRNSHSIIIEQLSSTSIPILSEEGDQLPFLQRKQWDPLWIVDPLDGTKEFIKRNGEFTVNIALVSDNKPVGGVIYVPVKDTLYFALRQRGSWKREDATGAEWDSLEQLERESTRLPADGSEQRPYTVVGSRSHQTPEMEQLLKEMRAQHPDLAFVSAGSSLKFCLVAEGKADIYPRLGPTMEWDTAAGQAIVEQAGGRVLVYDTGEPLRYNRKNLRNPSFVVHPPDEK